MDFIHFKGKPPAILVNRGAPPPKIRLPPQGIPAETVGLNFMNSVIAAVAPDGVSGCQGQPEGDRLPDSGGGTEELCPQV
jgi:hypothetical protein